MTMSSTAQLQPYRPPSPRPVETHHHHHHRHQSPNTNHHHYENRFPDERSFAAKQSNAPAINVPVIANTSQNDELRDFSVPDSPNLSC